MISEHDKIVYPCLQNKKRCLKIQLKIQKINE